jgi:hypothetical protein
MGNPRLMQIREDIQSTPYKTFGKPTRKSVSHTSVTDQIRHAWAQDLENGTIMVSIGSFASETIKHLYQMRRIWNDGAQTLENRCLPCAIAMICSSNLQSNMALSPDPSAVP